eukprot:403356276
MNHQNHNVQYQGYQEPLHNQQNQNPHHRRKPSHSFSSESSHSHFHEGTMNDEDRIGFIRKVYGILGSQLLLTAFMCLLPYMSRSIQVIMANNFGVALFFGIMGIVLSCALFCIPQLARKVPVNYCLMFAFTFCEAYMVAFCCAVINDGQIVLAAAFMTAAMVVALTFYAFTTKKDFTVCGAMLFVVSACFLMLGLFTWIMGPAMRLVYCTLGVILFGVYLVIDTQLVCGGKRYSLNKEDYIYGAIILYLDILNIFLYILQILAALKGE